MYLDTSNVDFGDGIQLVRIVHFHLNAWLEVFKLVLGNEGLGWRLYKLWT